MEKHGKGGTGGTIYEGGRGVAIWCGLTGSRGRVWGKQLGWAGGRRGKAFRCEW